MADHKAIISGAKTDEESIQQSEEILKEINEEVNNQLEERIRIYEHKILPALKENHVIFYQSCNHVEGFHKEFISNFFREEIFPYLQPVPLRKKTLLLSCAITGYTLPYDSTKKTIPGNNLIISLSSYLTAKYHASLSYLNMKTIIT